MARVVIYKSTTPGQRAAIFKPGTNVTFSENMVAGDLEVTVSSTGGGGGGGAPTNASYLTLGTDATLTNERVFAHSTRMTHTDGGAGGSYTLDLNVSGVSAGSYTYANVTVDAYGRVTAASSGTAPVTTTVNVDAGELTNTGTTTAAVLGLASAGTAGTYAYPSSMTTDAFGRVTSVTGGSAPVTTTVAVDAGELTNTGTSTAAVLGLANAGTAGTYSYPASMTTDAFGRVTSVTPGTAPISSHSSLSNLDWVNSGHTGLAYGVAAWNAAGAATVVNATADETMLIRRGGVLQWVPLIVGVTFLTGDTGTDGVYVQSTPAEYFTGTVV